MDRYYFFARLLPAAITSVPFVTFYVYTAGTELVKGLGTVWGAAAKLFQIAPSVAIVFLMVQLIRFISKELFQRVYFQDELDMPTTRYLLPSVGYFTPETHNKLRTRIRKDFDLGLPTVAEEQHNEQQARRQITVCVGQIRSRLRSNALLLRHNIEYGFFRNVLGGCVVGTVVSIGVLYYFRYVQPDRIAFWLTASFGLVYVLLLLFSRFVLRRYSHYYANVLYAEYLSS